MLDNLLQTHLNLLPKEQLILQIEYKYLDVLMPMNKLIEYRANYIKTSEAYINFVEMSQKILQQILNHLNLNQDS